MTIFGDLYQNKLLDSNNFIQFTHLRSASGINSDIIKIAAITLLIRIYLYIKGCKPDIYILVLRLQIDNKHYIHTLLYLPEDVHIWHNNW